jgi:hypothetical protein
MVRRRVARKVAREAILLLKPKLSSLREKTALLSPDKLRGPPRLRPPEPLLSPPKLRLLLTHISKALSLKLLRASWMNCTSPRNCSNLSKLEM